MLKIQPFVLKKTNWGETIVAENQFKMASDVVMELLSLKEQLNESGSISLMPFSSYKRFFKDKKLFERIPGCNIEFHGSASHLATLKYDDFEEELINFFKSLKKKKTQKIIVYLEEDFPLEKATLLKNMFDYCRDKTKRRNEILIGCPKFVCYGNDLVDDIKVISSLHSVCNVISECKIKLNKTMLDYRFLEVIVAVMESHLHIVDIEKAEEDV